MVYQNHKSRSFRVRRGVLQESVLGPVLFSLFINYLPASLLSSFMLTIWSFGFPPPPRSPLQWRPHKELCFDWSAVLSTGVFLNPSKCEASFFSVGFHQANHQPNLLYSTSASVAIFGVTFERTVSFSKHVSSLKAKFSRILFFKKFQAFSLGLRSGELPVNREHGCYGC